MKLFVIGFMGCGKSFVGRQIAAALRLPFYDLDVEIESAEHRTIAEIFEQSDENYFREMESKMLGTLLEISDFVLATGGGTPCFNDNLQKMKNAGFVIYIKATPEFLFKRLAAETGNRPLLRYEPDLLNFVKRKLLERAVFYERAHLIYELNENNEAKIVDELANYLSRFHPNFSKI